jgi:hypothetical protein
MLTDGVQSVEFSVLQSPLNYMNISKQEATAALGEIEDAITQTKRAIGRGGSSATMILWGIIWMVGYSCSQFAPRRAQVVWLCLVFIGAVSSWALGGRSRRLRSPNGSRIGRGWLVLFAYAFFWFLLLHLDSPPGRPVLHLKDSSGRQSGAFFATVAMCGYVVAGLWLGRFFIWLGAAVTLLTVAGYFLLPDWFFLWMAITGGGSLIVAGLYIRRFWGQAHGAA